ncbi:DMP19 family protein [Tsukamurella sp. DT100]|uniref:DMP19 family protein n=1 Tax=Tsukamurella sp. DT100 TaxID=3393415 RepID=UPI003CF0F35A
MAPFVSVREEIDRAWRALDRRWRDQGWDALTEADQQTLALRWLEDETDSGSLAQYFENDSGDHALIT